MTTIPLTKRGAEKLKAELHHLKHVERPAVINAIAEALQVALPLRRRQDRGDDAVIVITTVAPDDLPQPFGTGADFFFVFAAAAFITLTASGTTSSPISSPSKMPIFSIKTPLSSMLRM